MILIWSLLISLLLSSQINITLLLSSQINILTFPFTEKHDEAERNGIVIDDDEDEDKIRLQREVDKIARTERKCDICNQEFATYAGLKYHRARHKEETFPCTQCDKVYLSYTSLNGHLRAVHKGVVYGCPVCGQKFTRRGSVKRHMETQHKYPQAEIDAMFS